MSCYDNTIELKPINDTSFSNSPSRSSSGIPEQSPRNQPCTSSTLIDDFHSEETNPDDDEKMDEPNSAVNTQELKLNDEQSKQSSRKCSSYRGYLYASLSAALYLLSSVIVKYVKNIPPVEFVAIRSIGVLVFSIPYVIHSRENIFGPSNFRLLIFSNSFFSSAILAFKYIAFKYLPLGDVTVIVLCTPVVVTVLARIFLKEPCGYFQSFTVFLTLIGLILISKLPSINVKTNYDYNTKEFAYGIGAAMGAMILTALTFIFVRKLKSVHPSVIQFNLSWLAVIETSLLTFAIEEFTIPKCGLDQWLVIFLGTFGFLAQILFIMALKEENAGPVSIILAGVNIFLAFIWQIWFFNDIPDKYSISGTTIICFAVLLINVQKYFSN